jgi:hypothetical protein
MRGSEETALRETSNGTGCDPGGRCRGPLLKAKEDVAFRQEWAEKVGVGVGPHCSTNRSED